MGHRNIAQTIRTTETRGQLLRNLNATETAEIDGGHGILPTGGHWFSPVAAMRSPH